MPGVESLSDLERCANCVVDDCNQVLRSINGSISAATWVADVTEAPKEAKFELAALVDDPDTLVGMFRAFNPARELPDEDASKLITEANYYIEITEKG